MTEEQKKEKPEEAEKSGLKPAQVFAAGLAAVTAAFLGSFLGVYGTVLGAGLISILTTVGGEFYLRSLNTTKEATKKAKAKAAAISDARGRQTGVRPKQPETGRPVRITEQATVPTARIPVPGEAQTVYLPKPGEEGDEPPAKAGWGRRRWALLLATSAVAFVIGMVVVTGFELATGSSLSGDGRSTVGELTGGASGQTEHREQLRQQPPASDQPEPTGTAEPTEETVPPDERVPAPTGREEPAEPTDSAEPTSTQGTATPEPQTPTPDTGNEADGDTAGE